MTAGATPDFVATLRGAMATVRAETMVRADLRSAAVLVLLVPRAEGLCLLFTQRTQNVDAHRGEISFPGGAFDDSDSSFVATALREAWEEVGLPLDAVEVLGELDDIATRSGYLVRPVVGLARAACQWQPNRHEVEAIIEVPLAVIAEFSAWKDVPRLYQERLIPGPYLEYGDHVIWGATARILRQFAEVCLSRCPSPGQGQWMSTPATP